MKLNRGFLLSKSIKQRHHALTSIWGFPTVQTLKEEGGDAEATQATAHPRQKGVALIVAILAIAFMIAFVSDMMVNTSVNVEMAIMSRDRVKAEYLAKSGYNLGLFLVSASYLWDHLQASGMLGQKKEPSDGPESLWSMLNGQGIGAYLVDWAGLAQKNEDGDSDPFHLKGLMNEKAAEQMRRIEDRLTLKVSDEKSKINLSKCEKTGVKPCDKTLAQLEALFSCPPEKAYLEDKDLRPKELAYRIKDFISSNTEVSSESNLNSKNGPYEAANPPYKAKATFLDSIEELRLVKGWDADLHKIFSPYLTIYPYHLGRQSQQDDTDTLNINTAAPELLLCLIPNSLQGDAREQVIPALHKLKVSKPANIAGSSSEISKQLQSVFSYQPSRFDSQEASAASEISSWFSVRSDVFRIEVEAETGRQTRTLTAVIRRFDQGSSDSWDKKIEPAKTYQVLYWKIM